MRVAIRRTTRVGENAGLPLEDLGVQPNKIHRMTREDVLEGNRDLIAAAIEGSPVVEHLAFSACSSA